jgi:hypothetical protein
VDPGAAAGAQAEHSPSQYGRPHLHAHARHPGGRDHRVPIGESLRLWWELTSRAEDPGGRRTVPALPAENHYVLTRATPSSGSRRCWLSSTSTCAAPRASSATGLARGNGPLARRPGETPSPRRRIGSARALRRQKVHRPSRTFPNVADVCDVQKDTEHHEARPAGPLRRSTTT